jgi:enamine deaminase RidA (YjgF/YER057c/UK114 family)
VAVKKEVVRSGAYKDIFASGVRVGDALFLAGQVSIDNQGSIVGERDFVAQVRQVYANIEGVLAEFGATMDNIVDEMLLVTDIENVMGNLEEVFGVRAQAYGGPTDVTQTLVQVAALATPEMLIEIKCIAHF